MTLLGLVSPSNHSQAAASQLIFGVQTTVFVTPSEYLGISCCSYINITERVAPFVLLGCGIVASHKMKRALIIFWQRCVSTGS